MKSLTVETYQIRIYLSGPIEQAKQVIREDCLKEGLCVTIEPTIFIYTGGEETGYVVGLVNYPRFPMTPERLWLRARDLAIKLLEATYQHSVLISGTESTEWITKRES